MDVDNVALESTIPSILFGLRLWASVCLALYVAYWLQLDNVYWAGSSAAIVCQTRLGASLRKGWFLMVGTIVGAIFIVVLTASLPQHRTAFLLILALWVGACALMATLLQNFSSYAAALAGVTAMIIAGDQLGSVGGANGQGFFFALVRVSEICIGIVCADIVLAATDVGNAPRRLVTLVADITAEIMHQLALTLSGAGPAAPDSRAIRRELIRRVIALEPVIDEVIGESSQLRAHSPILYAAVNRLLDALASWRTVAAHLREAPDWAQRDAASVLHCLPRDLYTAPSGRVSGDTLEVVQLRERYDALARTLIAMPSVTPSLRLLADHTAEALAGISAAVNGLVLLVDGPALRIPRSAGNRLRVPDWLPAYINATRAVVTIGIVELLWVATAWPNGSQAMTYAAIGVTVFAPRDDRAYASTMRYMVGVLLTVACAAIAKFALLPGLSTFTALSITLGAFLVPLGALAAQSWQSATFAAAAVLFTPLLAPENQMSYDSEQFYNNALATVIGIGAAALSFRLLLPLTPAARSRRLLALTLWDLRRLAKAPIPRTADEWRGVAANRLSALPDDAEPLQRAQLLAALSMGTEIVRLRRIARRLGLTSSVADVLEAFAQGRSDSATKYLAALDNALASWPSDAPGASGVMRARGSILVISEGLSQHGEYFDDGAKR